MTDETYKTKTVDHDWSSWYFIDFRCVSYTSTYNCISLSELCKNPTNSLVSASCPTQPLSTTTVSITKQTGPYLSKTLHKAEQNRIRLKQRCWILLLLLECYFSTNCYFSNGISIPPYCPKSCNRVEIEPALRPGHVMTLSSGVSSGDRVEIAIVPDEICRKSWGLCGCTARFHLFNEDSARLL